MSDKSNEINEKSDIKNTTIFPRPNGPLIISAAAIELIDESGKIIKTAERFSICRCGHTGNQPYCDGSHNRMNFKG